MWISSSGRQASTTGMDDSGRKAKPVSRPAPTRPASMPGSDHSHSPRMPVWILSTVARVSSNVDGSTLKCISGTHTAASAESTSRLRSSAR